MQVEVHNNWPKEKTEVSAYYEAQTHLSKANYGSCRNVVGIRSEEDETCIVDGERGFFFVISFGLGKKEFNWNKTGSRQCTRAVWRIYAEIHSTHPGALMHYSGQSPEVNPDSSRPV